MSAKIIFSLLVITMLLASIGTAQMGNVAWEYKFPTDDKVSDDTVLVGLRNIRAVTYDADLLGDGISAVAVTNYLDNGRVHVFKTVGDNAMELVWTGPAPDSLGGKSCVDSISSIAFIVFSISLEIATSEREETSSLSKAR